MQLLDVLAPVVLVSVRPVVPLGVAVSVAEEFEILEDVGTDDGDQVVDLLGAGKGGGAREQDHALPGA